jgi:hypothetical protein
MSNLFSKEIDTFNKLSNFSFITEGANASSLRSHVESLGYTSKSTMDESGDLNSDLVEVLKKLATMVKKYKPDVKLKFGSGNDKFHRRLGYVSRHTKGEAVDVTVDSQNSKLIDELNKLFCYIRKENDGFSFIDEYNHPSKASTGGHYHFSFRAGKPEDTRSTKSICSGVDLSEFDNLKDLSNIEDGEYKDEKMSELVSKLSKEYGKSETEIESKIKEKEKTEGDDFVQSLFKMFLGDFKLEEKINEDLIRIKKLMK